MTSEHVDGAEKPELRNKIPNKNLRFPTSLKKAVQGIPKHIEVKHDTPQCASGMSFDKVKGKCIIKSDKEGDSK